MLSLSSSSFTMYKVRTKTSAPKLNRCRLYRHRYLNFFIRENEKLVLNLVFDQLTCEQCAVLKSCYIDVCLERGDLEGADIWRKIPPFTVYSNADMFEHLKKEHFIDLGKKNKK